MKKVCNVTNRYFDETSVRECKNDWVVQHYGVDGKCNVSIWICKKCKFREKPYDNIDGYVCNYGKDKK